MSEQTTPAPLTGDAKTLAEALANMLDTAAATHEETARNRRNPGSYREANVTEEAEAAAYDVMSDGFSSLANQIRTQFGLDEPNSWAQMFGHKG